MPGGEPPEARVDYDGPFEGELDQADFEREMEDVEDGFNAESENEDRVRLLAHIELLFVTYVARYTEARQAGFGHKQTIGLAIHSQTEGIEKATRTGNSGLMTEFMTYVRDFIPVLLDALDGRPAS